MNAVILAAGTGSRLRPLTIDQPKACLTVDGTPIGEHQFRAYAAAGIETVTVVTGYMSEQIQALCDRCAEELDIEIQTVHNEVFANTDNMYSLYCARDAVDGEPFMLSNGDVVFDPVAVETLATADTPSGIAVDTATYDSEAMKVTVDEDGQLDGISKEITEQDAAGTSIDLYRFSAETSGKLFDRIKRRIEINEEYTAWSELALNEVLASHNHDVQAVDIAGSEWVEIDDKSDLLAADRTFSSLDLHSKQAVCFDLDGTIYLDETPIEGAVELVSQLRASGVDVQFLSNNSSRWKPTYADRLSSLGIEATPDDIILSTDGVLAYLQENGVESAYVLGTDAMREAVAEQGIEPAADEPETVVVGFDSELTYEKAAQATLAVRDGAEFVVAHEDRVCPTEAGLIPDCGSIAAMIETASGRAPSQTFGKPNAEMLGHLLDEEGYAPDDVVVVGDRLSTDIELAERVGCESVAVLSGETSRRDIESADQSPSLVVESVDALVDSEASERTPLQQTGER